MSLLAWAVRSIVLQQGFAAVTSYVDVDNKARAAQAFALEQDKPLLVVGGPHGSLISGHFFGLSAHLCGDT